MASLQKLQSLRNDQYGYWAMFYPKSFYLLVRIYESKGKKKLAMQNYEKLLELWKEADEDLPELIDAKARLERLRG